MLAHKTKIHLLQIFASATLGKLATKKACLCQLVKSPSEVWSNLETSKYFRIVQQFSDYWTKRNLAECNDPMQIKLFNF